MIMLLIIASVESGVNVSVSSAQHYYDITFFFWGRISMQTSNKASGYLALECFGKFEVDDVRAWDYWSAFCVTSRGNRRNN